MSRFTIVIALLCSASARADVDGALFGHPADTEHRHETIEIEDTASPVDTPTTGVRAVGRRDLELTPKKNTDDLLRLVPGLYTSQHGSEGKAQQFFLRGFDAIHGSDLAIRVGGIPINEMSNIHGQGYADLGFVIPETVSGLVARKGPFDLEQGWFATAGSVDFELGVRPGAASATSSARRTGTAWSRSKLRRRPTSWRRACCPTTATVSRGRHATHP